MRDCPSRRRAFSHRAETTTQPASTAPAAEKPAEPPPKAAPPKPIAPAVLAREAAANARPTAVIQDDDGLEPSAIGSFATGPRPPGYRHTIAYPRPHPRGIAWAKRAFVATPPGNGWREIPNTKLRAVATPEQGYGNINAVVEVWTGGDFSEELQLFVNPPGGGHNGNDNSTFYGFDVDALQVLEFYPPSPLRDPEIKSDHAPAPEYPQATHVYDGSAWTVGRDGKPKFFFLGQRGGDDPSQATEAYAWLFDPVAMTVERGAPYPVRRDAAEGLIGIKAQGDPKRAVVFLQTTAQANQLSHFDAKRNRWFDHGDRKVGRVYGGQQFEVRYYSVLRIDPVRDIAVLMGEYDGIATLDLAKLKSGAPIGFTRVKRAEDIPWVTGDTSFVWDPVAKDWLCYGRNGVFSMNPVTWEMKMLDTTGPKPAQAGTFDRWFYSKKRDEFFTQNSVDGNWWSYRRPR